VPSCPLTDAVNGQLAQQQLLCLQFSVPRAGTKGSALAPHATPGSGPLASTSGARFLPLSVLCTPLPFGPSTKEMRVVVFRGASMAYGYSSPDLSPPHELFGRNAIP
jgi:hypothetical protein